MPLCDRIIQTAFRIKDVLFCVMKPCGLVTDHKSSSKELLTFAVNVSTTQLTAPVWLDLANDDVYLIGSALLQCVCVWNNTES
jgi:hypothetical protein